MKALIPLIVGMVSFAVMRVGDHASSDLPVVPTAESTAPAALPAAPSRLAPVAASASVVSGQGYGRVGLARAANGHFYADVVINGVTIHALIDTGASSVALSKADAARMGIYPSYGDYTGSASTANGHTRFAPVTLSSVQIGTLSRSGIEAAVIDGDMDETLLGMTFLSRFNVSIQGDTMVLS